GVIAGHIAEQLGEACLDAELEITLRGVQPGIIGQAVPRHFALELFEALDRLHVATVEARVLPAQIQKARSEVSIATTARDGIAQRIRSLSVLACQAQRLGFLQTRFARDAAIALRARQTAEQRFGNLE